MAFLLPDKNLVFLFLIKKPKNMKKLVFIAALFIVALTVQSCCVKAKCPGVTQIEAPQSNS